tara:strand:+ start:8430 stop:8834 length:405 start_codon:yes stop_codon:yes gene_type:complete
MEKLVLVVHLLIAVAIIGAILLQQGKGAEVGASFGGGASQTLFGSGGSWNFFSKLTAVLATLFFATSLTLAVMARNSAGVGGVELPALEIIEQENQQQVDQQNEIPSLNASDESTDVSGTTDVPLLEEQPSSAD